jgi:ribosomal protein L24
MTELEKGDYVKVEGGKYKNYEGIINRVKPKFIMIELKKDKLNQSIHVEKIVKVGRNHCVHASEVVIEMPGTDDLVFVDQFANEQQQADNVFKNNALEDVMEEMKEPTKEESESDHGGTEVNNAKIIHENYAEESFPSFDEVIQLKRDLESANNLIEIYRNMRIDDLASELSLHKTKTACVMRENEAKEKIIEGFKKLCKEIS